MNRIIIPLLLVWGALFASPLTLQKGYTEALAKAKQVDKPVMLVVSSHDCRYCTLFDNQTLSDALVIKALERDFVSVEVYPTAGEYLPRDLYTGSTPTIWFLTPAGDPMFEPIMGAVPKNEFIKILAIVDDAYKNAN